MLAISPRRAYGLACLFALISIGALMIDVPVARCAASSWPLGDLRKVIDISEAFAHGMGVLLILLTVAVLDPLSWRHLPRVAMCAFGAGLAAQLVKHLVPRIRPHVFDLSNHSWGSFFWCGATELAQSNNLSGRAIQSFPSGHSATAVGLAFGLAWLYPRGRWLFALFACLGALQRVQSMAHFVSDTFAGAALACLVVGMCWDERFLNPLFTRIESRHGGSPAVVEGGCGPTQPDAPGKPRRQAA